MSKWVISIFFKLHKTITVFWGKIKYQGEILAKEKGGGNLALVTLSLKKKNKLKS